MAHKIREVNGSLAALTPDSPLEHEFIILDTDYNNFFIYYECYLVDIEHVKKEIVEFGVMSRTPTLDHQVMSHSESLFEDLGLGHVMQVDQQHCRVRQPKDQINYCRRVDKHMVRNVELDQMMGRWLAMYALNGRVADLWIEVDRNPNMTSEYTHVIATISEDKISRSELRLDEKTGYLIGRNLATNTESHFAVFMADYNKEMILYQCVLVKGGLTRIEKLIVFSRDCQTSADGVDKANQIGKQLSLIDQYRSKLTQIKQFNCLREYRYQTRLLSESCIHFHDSEIVETDLSRMVGRWDRHLINEKIHFPYEYAIGTYHTKGVLDFFIYPSQYHSRKALIEGTNLLRSIIYGDKGPALANEAFIALDYDSYFLKYSCLQYEDENGNFKISETLNLFLRPRTTAQLAKNPKLFHQILNSIPEKSLNKIEPLIDKLGHQLNRRFAQIGRTLAPVVRQRLVRHRKDNLLSDKPDRQVYQSLHEICRHFGEDEQIFFDMESIVLSNWTVDYSSKTERVPYDSFIVSKASHTSYQLALYKDNKFIANSDRYFDEKDRFFWAYTEGRRAIIAYLFSNNDYRVSYTCEEQYVNGQLTANEVLRLHSSRENRLKPRDWFSYLEVMVANMQPKTLGKIWDLLEHVVAYSDQTSLTTKTMETLMATYLAPKAKFEDMLRNPRPVAKRPDAIVFESLRKVCKRFEQDELVQVDSRKIQGSWRIDWANWVGKLEKDVYQLDFTTNSGRFIASMSRIDQSSGKIVITRSTLKTSKQFKYVEKINEDGRRGQVNVLWTDYENHMIVFMCRENAINGVVTGNEVLALLSRPKSNEIQLSQYLDLMAGRLAQKTIAKIYHQMNNLVPMNDHIAQDNMRTMNDLMTITKPLFTEEIYYNFLAKGLAVKKVNKLLVSRALRPKEAQPLSGLTKLCRQFDDQELIAPTAGNRINSLNMLWLEWETRSMLLNNHDHVKIVTNTSGIWHKAYLGGELVDIIEKKVIPGTKWIVSNKLNGKRVATALIYQDNQIRVNYQCVESVFNGATAGKEFLKFYSRDQSSVKDLNFYLTKLTKGVRPVTLSKISDMIANLRPVYPPHTPEQEHEQQISGDTRQMNVLYKECQYFNQKDLFEPDFKRLTGRWRLRLANHIDFYKPYDTIDWIDRTDRFESKLRNKAAAKPSEPSVFVCLGKLRQVDDTNAFEEVFDGRIAVQAILYTDYKDLMLVYSCKQSQEHKGVIDNLKLLVRQKSDKVAIDVKQLKVLASEKLVPHVFAKITKFFPGLKYVYNETRLTTSSTPDPDDMPIGSDVGHQQPVRHKHEPGHDVVRLPIGLLVHRETQSGESCPDLDLIAQHNIDFRRLSGRWDAIYTSNSKWDHDCIYTVDTYDESNDSLIQMKHTGKDKHQVVIRHKSYARQQTVVDNIVFHSWILDTDYRTFRLAHTCYVKQVNGKGKRIDLQRLYVRNIDGNQLDDKLMNRLIAKSLQAGKRLVPIDRSNCTNNRRISRRG